MAHLLRRIKARASDTTTGAKKAVEKRHEEAGMQGASERKSEAYTKVR
jgi:hypothetical protein